MISNQVNNLIEEILKNKN